MFTDNTDAPGQVAQSDTIEEAEISEDTMARLGSMGNAAVNYARGTVAQ